MAEVFHRYLTPAKYELFGKTANGMPASGIMAMHITYPDTAYADEEIEDWEMGVNTTDWRQGLTILIRSPLATAAVAEAKNVIAIDLKQAAADHNNAKYTYDLGTEEACRFIAAKINSRRIKSEGERGLTKYLRARYVRQSSPLNYPVSELRYESGTEVRLSLPSINENGFPSEVAFRSQIKTTKDASATNKYMDTGTYDVALEYIGINGNFTIVKATSAGFSFHAPGSSNQLLNNTTVLLGQPATHTVILTWELKNPSTSQGYWSEANCGPVIQGLGPKAIWDLVAKPMDGGNMGLPALKYTSRSGITAQEYQGAGYNRFSIEGLNSTFLESIPPPDFHITEPVCDGITKFHPNTESDIAANRLRIEPLPWGFDLPVVSIEDQEVRLENGYKGSFSATSTNSYVNHDVNGDHLKDYTMAAAHIKHGINDSNDEAYARPFRTVGKTNEVRVNGLMISNEEKVFDDISVIDDLGNEFVLEVKSPWGTIIRDFTVGNARKDPATGEIEIGPSAPGNANRPNLTIQLPNPEDIPGGIFVRSGHDRIQAWSNQTWGMGGLAAPNPRLPGVAEAAGEPSQFDTHDRTLTFHCERILHDKLGDFHDLTSNQTAGSVPSGTTRLWTAHRIGDHSERGSLLKQTNNGVETGNLIPHHRIRFGRQGHSFVSPQMRKGVPYDLRRQLNRSHGSAYSLMFEAETEHKHHGFGDPASTNSATVFELDTLATKSSSSTATGSFSADGIPLSEISGKRLIDADGEHTSATHRSIIDYLFAPGQTHTNVEGISQSVQFATPSIDAAVSNNGAATKLTISGGTLSARNRFTTGSEFMLNGFMIGAYATNRPEAVKKVSSDGDGNWFVRGYCEGVIQPRVATELATVPPLFGHDPELLNMAAVPVSTSASIPSTSFTDATEYGDLGITKATDTTTGGTPDAFLCHWLAEYSHPTLYGTNREHFMTFRYRSSGMPRSLNYPSTNGLFLRNFSNPTVDGQPEKADPFERLYVAQWLQNYGFNGLNAGGHGTIEGLRSAGAVTMGHTTLREAQGTIRLFNENGTTRHSRGEGIGDSLDPTSQIGVVKGIDLDSDGEDLNKFYFKLDPFMAVDVSRRLPVRAWGFRTGSNAKNMLAGDPTEALAGNAQAVTESGRFDGGIHDSVDDLPNNSVYGNDWGGYAISSAMERTVPVGFIANDFTVEATPFERNVRQNNEPILDSETPIGIGAKLGITQNGMLSPLAMGAGAWDYELDDQRPTDLPISGAVLWLKAGSLDLEDGDPIEKWTDSINGIEFTQGTASAKPTYIKRDQYANNLPVINCDGNDKLSTPFDARLNTNEVTIFTVAWPNVDANQIGGIIESRAGTPVARSGFNLYARMDTSNKWQFWSGSDSSWQTVSSANNSANINTPSIISMSITGGDGVGSAATTRMDIDGYGNYNTTGAFWKATSGAYQVGNVPAAFWLNGKIAEVIQFDRALTDVERQEVESYLARKYDLPISTLISPHPGRMYKTQTKPINKGTDPFLDLVQWTGKAAYPQADSKGAMITRVDNSPGGVQYYRLRGNASRTNFSPLTVAWSGGTIALNYPPNGQSTISGSNYIITEAKPLLTSEITDVRQIQSRTEPRLGLVMEVESERLTGEIVDYSVVGTRAHSLHSDLNMGYQFPVLPSHQTKTLLPLEGFTVDGAGTATTERDFDVKPIWSPDSNSAKGAVDGALSSDTLRIDAKEKALDAWAVRGSADLPAWGGVYILRKSYLNRDEDVDILRTEIDSQAGTATTSQPHRKYVDYIVRPVRPLKLYGFASDLMNDGWVLGPRSSVTNSWKNEAFHRDKRYGVFEMNYGRDLGEAELISSAGSAFTMDYPDANEYDVTWHLIPTANMLQFAKSDAHRTDSDGIFNSKIEPRYSQSSVVGGGEPVYQSETRYSVGTGVMGDHARQTQKGTVIQSNEALRMFPRVTIKVNKGGGVYSVDDASVLPQGGGYIFALDHTGSLAYSGTSGNDVTITGGTLTDLAGSTVTDYINMMFYYTDVSSSVGLINDARSPVSKYAISPSFVDNAVIAMKIESEPWYNYDPDQDTISRTTLNYRGLLNYEPSDFLMTSQRKFLISDGNDKGIIASKLGSIAVEVDGREINENFAPPYIRDSNNIKWRVAEVIQEQQNKLMVFKDMSEKTLSASGMVVGDVIAGQTGIIGVRTTDAALHILNDAGGDFAGISLTSSDSLTANNKSIESYLGAHPMLKQINDHSKKYVARDTRGLNSMDVIRNLSQIDGRQIINERNGMLVYSDNTFSNKGLRLGAETGAKSISVSRLYDSPNEIVIVGDAIAGNEIVFIRVQDTERIRQAAANGDEGMVKTLRQNIPGLKSQSEARRLAKALLSRAENGAPMIRIQGMMNATSVSAGEIVNLNLPQQGVVGEFAVFEAKHHYTTGETDLIVAQYEKGIEGILADLTSNIVTDSGLTESAGDTNKVVEMSLSSTIKLISIHKVSVRNTNNTGFIIGANHKNGLGRIGVRDGSKRGYPIGSSKSRRFIVR